MAKQKERTGIRNDGTPMEYGYDRIPNPHKALTVGPQPKTGSLKQAAPQPKKPQPKKATK